MNDASSSRTEIAALIAKLTALGDAGKFDELSELFTSEGVFTLGNGSSANGPSAIKRMLSEFSAKLKEMPKGPSYLRHDNTTSVVEVIGEEIATGETYYLNLNERGLDHWGRFRDRFVRDAKGRWLFASREVVEEGKTELSFLNAS